MLTTVDVFVVVLDVHCARDSSVLQTDDYEFLCAALGVDVLVGLVSRNCILRSNTCLELVLSVDTRY